MLQPAAQQGTAHPLAPAQQDLLRNSGIAGKKILEGLWWRGSYAVCCNGKPDLQCRPCLTQQQALLTSKPPEWGVEEREPCAAG